MQEIVAAVIQSLKTNGRTIMQLTEATSVTDSDYFEIHGGRRIAYSHLYENLLSETTDIIDTYKTDIANLVAGKLDYYNLDWMLYSEQWTEANFNALADAIATRKFLLYRGNPALASQAANYIRVMVQFYSSYNQADVWLNDGVVTVTWVGTVRYASETQVTALGSHIDEEIGDINNLLSRHSEEITNLNATVNVYDQRMDGIEDEIEELEVAVAGNREAFLTQEEYNALVDAGTIDPDTKYYIYEDQ